MLFRDLKQNHPIYILDKQDGSYSEGVVTEVSFPHYDQNFRNNNGMNMPVMGQQNAAMVIDVTIKSGDKTATYSIPENLSVSYANSLVIATEPKELLKDIEGMRRTADQIIASVPKQEQIRDRAIKLLTELNPEYRDKRETEERFGKIEKSIDEMKGMFTDFLKQWNK